MARPKMLSLPVNSPHRKALKKKYAELLEQLPGMLITDLADFGVACRIALIDILFDHPCIKTAQVKEAMAEANPDFVQFFEAEPLAYDAACADVDRWSRGLNA